MAEGNPTREEMAAVCAERDRLLAAVRRHRDQKGDDRCWLDDDALYAALPEGHPADRLKELALHRPEEMLPNCVRFLNSRQPGGVPYVSPQREIERLGRVALAAEKLWSLKDSHDARALYNAWRELGVELARLKGRRHISEA